jgi:hypothetical protein
MTRLASTRWRWSRLSLGSSDARLAFGRMHEDASVELETLGGRIVCVASAGDTAIALAAADPANRVTAIDLNPAQIHYIRARLAGHPSRPGWVDRAMGLGRELAGWSRTDARAFVELADLDVQARVWQSTFDTPRFRSVLAIGVGPLGLLVAGPSIRRVLPRMDRIVGDRLRRGFARTPNRTNPYAPLLMLGVDLVSTERPATDIDLRVGDVAEYLEAAPPRSIDGFSLSNIADATSPGYRTRLFRAIARTAAPGALVILRSFAEPLRAEERGWAARDRSHIWGRIHVGSAESLVDGWGRR